MKRGYKIKNMFYTSDKKYSKRFRINLVRENNPSALLGRAYGPWTNIETYRNHRYTELPANEWMNILDELILVIYLN